MTQVKVDPIEVYQAAAQQARRTVAGVKPDQMQKPTPCTEWDVTALLNHLANGLVATAGMISGGQVPPEKTQLESLDAAAASILKAAKAPGGLEKKVMGRQGEVPVAELLSGACLHLALHGWDLAKATGQDSRIDPKVVEFLSPVAEGIAKRGPSRAFAAPVEVPANASRQDKMLALTGRKP